MNSWGDLITRARGLSGHLLRPGQLAPLCAAGSVAALAAQLSALRLIPTPATGALSDEHSIELALRRRAGAGLDTLARWAGSRSSRLAPLYDDEDRRTLRALVRGAIGGVSPEARLAGLIATPALPLRALEQLAHAGNISTIAALLVTWGHPFGAVLATEARRHRPDLLQIEMALVRTLAERGREAGRAADGAMRHFVERVIDLENVRAALVLADHPADIEPASVFVEGGALVTLDDLLFAASSKRRAELVARLAPRVRGTPLAAALEAGERPADDAALEALAAELQRLARNEPLGLAPVILLVLRQRVELRALLRILWSISLGVPRPAIELAVGRAA